MSQSHFNYGEKNPSYKGENAGYSAIHAWVRRRKLRPELCECGCGRKAIDLANISGKYLRDLSDWEYLSRKCHMDKDGRNNQLRKSGISRKLPLKECPVCLTNFHSDDKDKIVCGMKCRGIWIWNKRRKNENLASD